MGNLEKNIALNAENRADFALIAKWIAPNAKVLDLGCGDGALLTKLRKTHNVRAYGVEKDDANWLKAMNNDIDVIQMDLESGLSGFEAQSFDVVILSQTLQAVLNTEAIVKEMLRVGREVIVTFPNFGYWRYRFQLALAGHMPVSDNLPYQWYDTPNVHLCTIHDFDEFCRKSDIVIQERLVLNDKEAVYFMPNMMGALAMYRLRSK
ncbi:MAG: methionine biosynthesis protein MetW [Candidatus Methylopumilus sp.]|jgi:SAM-dependent methyltransferase|nr:methionine biosynthesis protein MetW [Candidatus Methylopumilus sp.]